MITDIPRKISRSERRPASGLVLEIDNASIQVLNGSMGGVGCRIGNNQRFHNSADEIIFVVKNGEHAATCKGRIAWTSRTDSIQEGESTFFGIVFSHADPTWELLLRTACSSPRYIREELRSEHIEIPERSPVNALKTPLHAFYKSDGDDILSKCNAFGGWINDMQRRGLYQNLWRVTLTSALDNRVTIFDPLTRSEREVVCFDSNSYLGLHKHPKVVEKSREVLAELGYGSPSSQILSGTQKYVRELEGALADLHGRDDAIVFPTGFAANIGTIGALIRDTDLVVRDQLAHASIHDGCTGAHAGESRVFKHNDLADLESILKQSKSRGKLVVTDGIFSMHGSLSPVPDLIALTQKSGARLMIDDAHGLGVLGKNGRGIEEHFGCERNVDILMGTLSKTIGSLGGYVTASRDVIYYLRYFARSGSFTTSLPAHICAGAIEALKVIQNEPERRTALWDNIRSFVPALRDMGYLTSDPVSPILTVFVGPHNLMWNMSRRLLELGVKVGGVMFPVVPQNCAILRMTLNSCHTKEDLEFTLDAMQRVGHEYGILGKSKEELSDLGKHYSHV